MWSLAQGFFFQLFAFSVHFKFSKENLYFKFQALDNSEFSTANDLHVRLMLDFPSEVSQWMVGVKKLIHELIELKEKTETDQITENSITNSI